MTIDEVIAQTKEDNRIRLERDEKFDQAMARLDAAIAEEEAQNAIIETAFKEKYEKVAVGALRGGSSAALTLLDSDKQALKMWLPAERLEALHKLAAPALKMREQARERRRIDRLKESKEVAA